MKKLVKRITLILLSVIIVMNSTISSEAAAPRFTTPLYDPASLLDLIPETNIGLQIPSPMSGVLPSIPQIPAESNNYNISSPTNENVTAQVSEDIKTLPVDVVTGQLLMSNTDLDITGIGLDFNLERTYTPESEKTGAFGVGWDYNLDAFIRMYSEYAISEFRLDGSTRTYDFVKDDPNAYVTSYDNDSMTNYQLEKGHYDLADGDRLERISQYEYIVTTKKGEKYTYNGYQAIWRENQSYIDGRLIKYEDRFGNSIQYTYNSDGHLIKVTDTAGRIITLEWQNGHIVKLTDPAGQITRYEYDTNNRLIKVIFPDGSDTVYDYNEQNKLTSVTNEEDETTYYLYNNDSKINEVKNNDQETKFKLTYTGNQVIKENALGYEWQYTIEDGHIIKETDPVGDVTDYTYLDDNLITKSSEKGVISYQYDEDHQLIYEKDIDGITKEYTYNIWGEVETTSINGQIIETNIYNSQGQLIQSVNGKGASTYYKYNSKGLLVEIEDEASNITGIEYDDYGNQSKILYPDQSQINYEYDILGRNTKIILPSGITYAFIYDLRNRAIQISTNNDKNNSYQYDKAGRLVEMINPLGYTVHYDYDDEGNLIKFTDEMDRETTYTYYADGRINSVTQNGDKILYSYNEMGQIVEMIENNNITTISYGIYGPETVKNIYGTFTYSYDDKGRGNKCIK